MTRFGTILLLTVIWALTPGWLGAAEIRIGIVDTRDILANSPEVKRVQENLRRKMEEMGRPLEQRRQDIGRQVQEFEKQAAVMKEEARKKRQEEIQKKIGELQQQSQQADRELAQLEEREMAPVMRKLEQAVEAVAREEKLDLILPKAAVIAITNKSMDVTEKVRSHFR